MKFDAIDSFKIPLAGLARKHAKIMVVLTKFSYNFGGFWSFRSTLGKRVKIQTRIQTKASLNITTFDSWTEFIKIDVSKLITRRNKTCSLLTIDTYCILQARFARSFIFVNLKLSILIHKSKVSLRKFLVYVAESNLCKEPKFADNPTPLPVVDM